MIISIIGWYGTETMGDKAIFDGILAVFEELSSNIHVQVGSLFPFYSQRTFIEEKNIFQKTASNMTFSIFDMKIEEEIYQNISKSDMILFGGGPLMDLEELFLIKYSFEMGKKYNIPCVIMGAGIGPLKQRLYINVVEDILKLSNLIILRDSISLKRLIELYGSTYDAMVLPDPAIISIEEYKKIYTYNKNKDIIVNFRDYSEQMYAKRLIENKKLWRKFIFELKDLADKVYFMPMHNFFIGEDDRYCIASILDGENIDGFEVIDVPIDLHTMYSMIASAYACVGMRYHSVVMQTVLNGNNLIIDYTGKNTGKIYGFLKDIDKEDFYKNRRYCMDTKEILDINKFIKVIDCSTSFNCSYFGTKDKYVEVLKKYV